MLDARCFFWTVARSIVLVSLACVWLTFDAAPASAAEPVSWVDTWGTTADGGSLWKIGPPGWSTGGISTKALVSGDGYLEFSAAGLADSVVGLSSRSGRGFERLDFALQLGADGSVKILEAGVVRALAGSYASGDTYRS